MLRMWLNSLLSTELLVHHPFEIVHRAPLLPSSIGRMSLQIYSNKNVFLADAHQLPVSGIEPPPPLRRSANLPNGAHRLDLAGFNPLPVGCAPVPAQSRRCHCLALALPALQDAVDRPLFKIPRAGAGEDCSLAAFPTEINDGDHAFVFDDFVSHEHHAVALAGWLLLPSPVGRLGPVGYSNFLK